MIEVLYNNTNAYPLKFLELFEKQEGKVLDCGSGDRRLNTDRIINFDISKVGVDVVGDGHQLPFKDKSFNLILSQAVLEHYRHPWIAAEELYRVCTPGGFIYAEAAFMQPFHSAPYHFFNMTVLGIEELLHQFEKIDSGAFGGLSDTFPWLCREAWVPERLIEIIKIITKETDKILDKEKIKRVGSGVYFLGRRTIR